VPGLLAHLVQEILVFGARQPRRQAPRQALHEYALQPQAGVHHVDEFILRQPPPHIERQILVGGQPVEGQCGFRQPERIRIQPCPVDSAQRVAVTLAVFGQLAQQRMIGVLHGKIIRPAPGSRYARPALFTPGGVSAKLRRMSAPALHISRLCKSYGKSVALDDVSLDIMGGEFFGLVGANGAGKTTLVKCALDFCDIQSGDIRIFGTPHRETAARSRIAFLPERFTPPHYLSGRDFLRYLAGLHRGTYDENRARSMLEALELDVAALDKPARAYSKGMTQKLGLAACLLADKDLLILDEPTSGLDPKARALLKRELRRQHESGKTVLMTTQHGRCRSWPAAVCRHAGGIHPPPWRGRS